MSEDKMVQQGNFKAEGFVVDGVSCVPSERNDSHSQALVERNPAPNASAPTVSASPTVRFILNC